MVVFAPGQDALGCAGLVRRWVFSYEKKARFKTDPCSSDIGGILYGNSMRTIILTSIALSQIGFVAGASQSATRTAFVPALMFSRSLAYTIFVAENLQAFVLGVSNCATRIAIKYLIAAQLIVVLPLAMVRNLAALSSTALIADAFILIGCEEFPDMRSHAAR